MLASAESQFTQNRSSHRIAVHTEQWLRLRKDRQSRVDSFSRNDRQFLPVRKTFPKFRPKGGRFYAASPSYSRRNSTDYTATFRGGDSPAPAAQSARTAFFLALTNNSSRQKKRASFGKIDKTPPESRPDRLFAPFSQECRFSPERQRINGGLGPRGRLRRGERHRAWRPQSRRIRKGHQLIVGGH